MKRQIYHTMTFTPFHYDSPYVLTSLLWLWHFQNRNNRVHCEISVLNKKSLLRKFSLFMTKNIGVHCEIWAFIWPKISEFTAKFGPSFDQKYRSSLRNLCLQNNKHIRGHCKTFTNWYLTADNVFIVQGHWSVQILNQ